MEHKGTVRLETDRLILRPFTLEDAEASFRNWAGDEKVTKFLRWPTHESVSVTESVLSSWVEGCREPDFYQWAIVPKNLGEPIGTISVVDQDEKTEKLQFGYCIGSRWWGNGYTSEAFERIIAFCFQEVKAQRIEAMYDPNNPNSGKVMRRCGLSYEGTLRKADWSNQGIVDACVCALLREDWEKMHPESLRG